MKIRTLLLTLVVMASFGLAGCNDFGQVDQGRTVGFDPATKTVTFVQDVDHDQLNPNYSGSIVSFKLPVDPAEIGPLPKVGERVKLDLEKKCIILYNTQTKALETVPITIVDVQKDLGRNHSLVKGKTFPIIDKAKNSITEYSARQRSLVTFTVPESMIDLPPATWEAGDEVRLYYKEKGQALRFMNISKTNIYKK